jgi:hypothetical protein
MLVAILKIYVMFKPATPNGNAIHNHPVGLVTLPVGLGEPIRLFKDSVIECHETFQFLG